MANLLEDIGRGLRIAGGVSSPQVAQENMQFEQIKAQRSEMILQMAARAAESGSITPETFQKISQKYGGEIPSMGPSLQTQKTQADMQREQKLQQYRAAAKQKAFAKPAVVQQSVGEAGAEIGPDGTGTLPPVNIDQPAPISERQADYANALIESGEPELVKEGSDLLKTIKEKDEKHPPLVQYQQARDLAASRYGEDHPKVKQLDAMIAKLTSEAGGGGGTQYERALETLQRLQLQVESGQPLTREQELQAQSARTILEQQRPFIDPVTQKLGVSQPITVPPSMTVGATRKPTPNVMPAMTGGRRPLDAGTEKKFTDIGNGFKQIQSIQQGFKPDYGGFVSETAGQLAIQGGRRGLPAYEEMANFWQQYEQWITDMRAAKFGMTLTGYELEQFNKYRSRPSDSPEIIVKNMQRQLDIVNGAAQRELNALNESGQNVKQGEALSGIKKGEEPEVKSLKTETIPEGKGIDWTPEEERELQELERKK